VVFKSVKVFTIFREEKAKAYSWDMLSVVRAEPLHGLSEIIRRDSLDIYLSDIPFSWFAWRFLWK
jgi:hypothetical protein